MIYAESNRLNMWRTVSARLRGAKQELIDMGLETDGMVESTSKLRAQVKALTGFDIMEDENTFKNIMDIVVGIGESWEDLTDLEQAGLLESLAGDLSLPENVEIHLKNIFNCKVSLKLYTTIIRKLDYESLTT